MSYPTITKPRIAAAGVHCGVRGYVCTSNGGAVTAWGHTPEMAYEKWRLRWLDYAQHTLCIDTSTLRRLPRK